MNWTHEQKKLFIRSFVLTAKNYDKDLSFDLAEMVTSDIEDLNFEECMKALVNYRRDPKNKFWPKASDIRSIITPQIDKRAVSVELAHKIDKVIAKHGWPWPGGHQVNGVTVYTGANKQNFPTWKEAVISEVGKIGYHAICSRGDWQKTVKSANATDEQFFIAQMRDQIVSTITLREQGVDISKIEMPKPGDQISAPAKDLFDRLGLSTKEFPSIKPGEHE
jgi:hypothetical protein